MKPQNDPEASASSSTPTKVTPPPDTPTSGGEPTPVSSRYIWLMVVAQFGVFLALITPIAVSLSIRVAQLAPGHEEYLGYVTGAGAAVSVLVGPLLGVLSDRTRSRLGRRKPFLIAGLVLGPISLVVIALAPSMIVLALGWIMSQVTWGLALGGLTNSMADRVPEQQRGRLAGFVGFVNLVAPVAGVGLSSGLAGNNLLLFGIPGLLGALLLAPFILFIPESDSRNMPDMGRLSPGTVLGKYVFKPARYPDYSLNLLGRALFYFGLTLCTTFTAFFLASRMGVGVQNVAGTMAVLSALGVVATAIGALGSGFLSDRLRRRRAFVLASGILFGLGSVGMALSPTVPLLFASQLTTSLALGMFSSVDQALALDVLPERATNAGRFMAIFGLTASIPQSVAPLVAPVFLTIGVAAGQKNYPLLFAIAGAFTVLGGIVITRIRSVR